MNSSAPIPGAALPSRRVAAVLREAISSGELAPGDRLPSERALAVEHDVARNTAREAVRQLADEGLVTAEHGRGVFVRTKPRLMRFGSERYSLRLREETDGLPPFAAEAVKQGRTPHVETPSVARIVPPPEVAERLGLDPEHDAVVRRENWYYADGEPVQVGVTYAAWSLVEGTPVGDSPQLDEAGGIYVYFERLGHTVRQVREEITARMPTPEEAHGLAVPDGVPVLVVLHTGIDQDGRAFEVTRFVMRADTGGLDYAMPVDE